VTCDAGGSTSYVTLATDAFWLLGGSLSPDLLTYTQSASGTGRVASDSSRAVTTGKYYWEVKVTALVSGSEIIRVTSPVAQSGVFPSALYQSPSGNVESFAGGSAAYGAAYGVGDTIGVALDAGAGAIWFSKNGVWQGSPSSGLGAARTGLSSASGW